MIHLSTEKIKLKSSSQELFDFLGQTSNMAEIISFKKTKHVQVNGDNITFILKWAARFNFSITAITEEYVLIESTEEVPFATAIRFDIESEKKESHITVHAETDTSPVIDFTFESKVKTWVSAIVENLKEKFG
ncbi:MAG: hypothetical protein CMP61_11585 [Flavobacteriales bacterium]|nr:hypothetical protein [Flavobacteriales bacterium]MBO72105.1 hypothetical protein [Flavobacteriales bacterium]|tara:strand:+ start:136 stop:534 length:399 start_codon:yes stop_codon:yes gene_type:complete